MARGPTPIPQMGITLSGELKLTPDQSAHFLKMERLIMALRDDIRTGFESITSDLTDLRAAIEADKTGDAAHVAELQAIIDQLQADATVSAAQIASMQGIVDAINTDNDAVVAGLADVDASVKAAKDAVG